MDSFVILVDGSELARVSAQRIECGKKCVDKFAGTMEDDPRMLRIVAADGKAIAVFYVSSADNITVEKEVSA